MAQVNTLLRALGIGLLSSLAARLPARVGSAIQLALVVVGSLLPLWPLLEGWVHLQDLLAYSALWMALSVATTLIRMNTLQGRDETTRFLTLHYAVLIGILSVITSAWALILLALAGPSGGWFVLALTAAGLLLSNAWSLADGWFWRGGNQLARPWQVLLPGYLRWVPVLLATVASAVLIVGEYPGRAQAIAGAALVFTMAAIDITLAVLSLRRTAG